MVSLVDGTATGAQGAQTSWQGYVLCQNQGLRVAMTIPEWVHHLSAWTESHPGLGGWVGAVGALLAIIVTWIIARRETNRAKRQARDIRLAEGDLITKIITEFEAQIQHYKKLGPDAPEAAGYDSAHMNDPEWHSMRDLAFLPVTHWPTLKTYAEFKRYWFACINFTKMAGTTNVNKAELYDQWEKAHHDSHRALMNSLRSVQRRR